LRRLRIERQEFEISDLKSQNLKSQIRRRRLMKHERFEDLPVWKAAAEINSSADVCMVERIVVPRQRRSRESASTSGVIGFKQHR
jgi:hypothetical protein